MEPFAFSILFPQGGPVIFNETAIPSPSIPSQSQRIPFQVGLWDRTNGNLFCGGSIISPLYILTAASCLFLPESGRRRRTKDLMVVAGDYDISANEGTEQVRGVSQVIAHNQFRHLVGGNDVALLKLDRELAFNEVVTEIRVPRPEGGRFSGDVTVSGWGASRWDLHPRTLRPKRQATVMQQRQMEIVSETECKRRFPPTRFSTGIMCCKSRALSACYGDHGGPAICKQSQATSPYRGGRNANELVLCGIVSPSSSKNCANRNNNQQGQEAPEMFTDVAQNSQWINKMAGISSYPSDNSEAPSSTPEQEAAPIPTPPAPPAEPENTTENSGVYCEKEKMYIPTAFICDGENDCADGIDEKNCTNGDISSPSPGYSADQTDQNPQLRSNVPKPEEEATATTVANPENADVDPLNTSSASPPAVSEDASNPSSTESGPNAEDSSSKPVEASSQNPEDVNSTPSPEIPTTLPPTIKDEQSTTVPSDIPSSSEPDAKPEENATSPGPTEAPPPASADPQEKGKYLLYLCQFKGGFVCPLDDKCVPKTSICNGTPECPSGIDEDPIYCEFRKELLAQKEAGI